MSSLPSRLIMAAINGARRTTEDHPALPVTPPAMAQAAATCAKAGAGALHLHVRDDQQRHVLDAGRYREALAAIAEAAPGLAVQVTTEAVGRYSPAEMVAVLRALEPAQASVAVTELAREGDALARQTYAWAAEAGVQIQHILYAPEDLIRLASLLPDGQEGVSLLFVLGRYTENQQSDPRQVLPFLGALAASPLADRVRRWMVCAFGQNETRCLLTAAALGSDVRVGFENSLWHADGTLARDNAERVAAIAAGLRGMGLSAGGSL